MMTIGIDVTLEDLAHRSIKMVLYQFDDLVTLLNNRKRSPPIKFEEFSENI